MMLAPLLSYSVEQSVEDVCNNTYLMISVGKSQIAQAQARNLDVITVQLSASSPTLHYLHTTHLNASSHELVSNRGRLFLNHRRVVWETDSSSSRTPSR